MFPGTQLGSKQCSKMVSYANMNTIRFDNINHTHGSEDSFFKALSPGEIFITTVITGDIMVKRKLPVPLELHMYTAMFRTNIIHRV